MLTKQAGINHHNWNVRQRNKNKWYTISRIPQNHATLVRSHKTASRKQQGVSQWRCDDKYASSKSRKISTNQSGGAAIILISLSVFINHLATILRKYSSRAVWTSEFVSIPFESNNGPPRVWTEWPRLDNSERTSKVEIAAPLVRSQ